MAKVVIRHRTLDTTTEQPESTAANLIEQGGWEVDERKSAGNPQDVIDRLKKLKSGYVGGDQGSRDQGGQPPPEPSGRAPESTAGGN